ncbi:MAG TPA: hypothetical protein VIN07_10385 [Flavipsychrobacter sp.]
MKKVILILTCFLSVFLVSKDSYALKIFGIEIKYERGIKEWNADRTATECVSRGMCSLTIGGSGGISARLGNVDGNLVIAIPASYYNAYPEDFEGDLFDVNCDVEVPYADASTIGFSTGLLYSAGTYPVVYDAEEDEYFVILQ